MRRKDEFTPVLRELQSSQSFARRRLGTIHHQHQNFHYLLPGGTTLLRSQTYLFTTAYFPSTEITHSKASLYLVTTSSRD